MLHHQAGVGLGFLWLQEKKWISPEPNYNLLEGEIKTDDLRADSDANSEDASALLKICFHSVPPVCKSEACQVFLPWILAEIRPQRIQSLHKCLF